MTKRKSPLEEALAEIRALEKQVEPLQRIAARVEPSALVAMIPKVKTVEEIDDEVSGKILALGFTGMAPPEIRAELGITEDMWFEKRAHDPAFRAITNRAKDLGKARYMKQARRAMEMENWKFPHAKVRQFLAGYDEDRDQVMDMGDASELIILDARPPNVIAADET